MICGCPFSVPERPDIDALPGDYCIGSIDAEAMMSGGGGGRSGGAGNSGGGGGNPLDRLEQQLERSIENVRQIKIIVSDFQPQGQPALNQKLQQVVKDLQEIDKLRPKVQDLQVPLEVFDYIDEGRNPQYYTKDCMEKALAKNEEERGKIDAYRMFKARLMLELTNVFPKQMANYRALRGDERVTNTP